MKTNSDVSYLVRETTLKLMAEEHERVQRAEKEYYDGAKDGPELSKLRYEYWQARKEVFKRITPNAVLFALVKSGLESGALLENVLLAGISIGRPTGAVRDPTALLRIPRPDQVPSARSLILSAEEMERRAQAHAQEKAPA